MKSLGKKADGLRLERMQASPLWHSKAFRNLHLTTSGLRDTTAPRPSLSDFLCGGERRTPTGPVGAHAQYRWPKRYSKACLGRLIKPA